MNGKLTRHAKRRRSWRRYNGPRDRPGSRPERQKAGRYGRGGICAGNQAVQWQRSSLGWRIRAAVEDPETLQAGGANLPLLRTGLFALGALLAGLSGALVAPQVAVAPGMDSSIVVSAFIVAIIGGLGSVVGAALGALIIGVAETVGTAVAPSWASSFIYLVMIIVLVVRPSGLLGIPEARQ